MKGFPKNKKQTKNKTQVEHILLKPSTKSWRLLARYHHCRRFKGVTPWWIVLCPDLFFPGWLYTGVWNVILNVIQPWQNRDKDKETNTWRLYTCGYINRDGTLLFLWTIRAGAKLTTAMRKILSNNVSSSNLRFQSAPAALQYLTFCLVGPRSRFRCEFIVGSWVKVSQGQASDWR